MKRAALILLLCAACKQQDPAMTITMVGPFLVPGNADRLHLEVVDVPGAELIRGKDWCYNPTPNCDPLPPMGPPLGLNASVTIVETGASHPHVKINATLLLGSTTVGAGTIFADFAGGQTIFLTIQLTRTP